MRDVEIALAVSTREWAELLHRFVVDHGGARVRLYVMRPEDAFSESFDVLMIDDICSFLSPHLVKRLNRQGRRVIGVYSPDEFPDGKDRLLACEVTEVIEADASPEEFLEVVGRLGLDCATSADHRGPKETEELRSAPAAPGRGSLVAVGSPPGGCGATEVAIAIARRMEECCGTVALLDLDQRAPSVAQRLGLGLHPNLLTAIDAVHHRRDSLDSCWQTPRGSTLRVLSGVPSAGDRSRLRKGEVAETLLEVSRKATAVVVNIGLWDIVAEDRPLWAPNGAVAEAVLELAGVLVGVALPTPVGMVRITEWIGGLWARHPGIGVHVVFNRVPGSPMLRRALLQETLQTVGRVRVAFLPDDQAVAQAAWNGVMVEKGRFRRGCDRLADLIAAEQGEA